MSTDDLMREQPPRRIEPEQTPKPDPEAAEAAEVAGTPDAVKQASARRDAVRERMDQVRGRGVEWVRPTDLIARHSAHAAGRGLDFQAELARRTRTPIGAGVRRLGDRARRLPPISAFGRSTAPQAQQVSRSGVSMS